MADSGATGDFLRLLAERAAADPAYLSWVMRAYAEAEGGSSADVLARLGVAEKSAADFLVSLRPAGDRFVETLRTICVRFGVDETMLLSVLREVEVLEAFRAGGASTAPSGADAGLLMAARMREKGNRARRVTENDHTRDDEVDDAR